MHGSNNVEFSGVLVDRHYTSSQRCAQLVFETAEGIRLSLSRNINMARSLTLGLTYKVKGPEYSIGKKHYIHEPTATLVPVATTPFFKRYKIVIPIAVSLVVILGGVGTLAFASSNATGSQPTLSEQKPAVKSASKTTSPTSTPITTTQPASEVTDPSTPQQQTVVASTPSTKKTTSTATKTTTPSQSAATPTVNTPTAPATQEDTPSITPPVEQTPAPIEPSTPDPEVTP